MTKSRRRQLLLGADLLLALGIAGAVALAVFPPRPAPPPDAPDEASAQPALQSGQALSVSAYAVIYQRNLQAPLAGVATAQPAPLAVSPLPNLTLLGTVVEQENSYGIFRTPSGQTRLAGVGETVEGAKVAAITVDSVTLTLGGNSFKLSLPPKGAGK